MTVLIVRFRFAPGVVVAEVGLGAGAQVAVAPVDAFASYVDAKVDGLVFVFADGNPTAENRHLYGTAF